MLVACGMRFAVGFGFSMYLHGRQEFYVWRGVVCMHVPLLLCVSIGVSKLICQVCKTL